jgi:hypothetical protein
MQSKKSLPAHIGEIVQRQPMVICVDGEPQELNAIYLKRPDGALLLVFETTQQAELYNRASAQFRSEGQS